MTMLMNKRVFMIPSSFILVPVFITDIFIATWDGAFTEGMFKEHGNNANSGGEILLVRKVSCFHRGWL